ncbi:MAG: DUF1330 domain-containing protein [Novosphingobium sp.]
MSAYVVFIREGEIVDPEAMKKYQEGNRSGAPNPDMKVHTVYGKHENIEGEDCDGIVILEFPDTQSARDWYYSEDYQSRAKFRMAAAPYRGFIVEGF